MTIIELIMGHSKCQEYLKTKAHYWLPAYFSRYDLTPEERLLIDKKNALEDALQNKDVAKSEEILNLFPDLLDQPLNNGDLAINFAVKKNLFHTIDMLLGKGADPTIKDRVGLSALDIALQKQDKVLFSKLIANTKSIGTSDDFLKTLDSTVVTGISARNCLAKLQADAKKKSEELKNMKEVPKEHKKLFLSILKGDFVSFKQIAKIEDLKALEEKLGQNNLLIAAILGSPLILDQIIKMGIQFSNLTDDTTKHPLQYAFCSQHPVEAYIPFFEKLNFDIQSVASNHQKAGYISWISPEEETVRYFDLLVYEKVKNAQNMDPIAITGWDVAFACFSLLSWAGNYNSHLIPSSLLPLIQLGLNCSNYVQAISLLLFKISYAREGKISAGLQQLMTHYMISNFLPVRIYYAGMTVYSALKTCSDHRYRSYTDLSKKLIVQLPAGGEFVYYVSKTAYPYIESFYNKLFGITKFNHYNWNKPQSPKTDSHKTSSQTDSSNKDSSVQTSREKQPFFENTPFMENFGKESMKAASLDKSTHTKSSQTQNGITGSPFNGKDWIYQPGKNLPGKVTTFSAAIEAGKGFHQNTAWYHSIKGTPLEKAYNNMHLQAAGSASYKKYDDGLSFEAAFRVDLKGRSALEHFVRTILEGGAHFEEINSGENALATTTQKGWTEELSNTLDCLITSRAEACNSVKKFFKKN